MWACPDCCGKNWCWFCGFVCVCTLQLQTRLILQEPQIAISQLVCWLGMAHAGLKPFAVTSSAMAGKHCYANSACVCFVHLDLLRSDRKSKKKKQKKSKKSSKKDAKKKKKKRGLSRVVMQDKKTLVDGQPAIHIHLFILLLLQVALAQKMQTAAWQAQTIAFCCLHSMSQQPKQSQVQNLTSAQCLLFLWGLQRRTNQIPWQGGQGVGACLSNKLVIMSWIRHQPWH